MSEASELKTNSAMAHQRAHCLRICKPATRPIAAATQTTNTAVAPASLVSSFRFCTQDEEPKRAGEAQQGLGDPDGDRLGCTTACSEREVAAWLLRRAIRVWFDLRGYCGRLVDVEQHANRVGVGAATQTAAAAQLEHFTEGRGLDRRGSRGA